MPDYATIAQSAFYEKQLVQKLIATNRQVSEVYRRFIQRVTPYLQQYRYNFRGVVIHDPALGKAISDELTRFKNEFTQYVESEKIQAWNLASNKNSAIIDQWAAQTSAAGIVNAGMGQRNIDAMNAFVQRKTSGMNLSDRVWQLATNTKEQLEYYLESGLAAGRSADVISRDVRQVLNNPDKRFRRVRNAAGQLVPSKPMEQYHPGRGVYRSSYQNARRLARTEITMAYRQSDMESWRDLDMVLGYEVKLSNAHSVVDICDAAQGRYPKEFNFIGWHAQCMCHAIPILMTPEQFDAWNAGEAVSVQYVDDVPQGMRDWLIDKKDSIERLKSKPYFIHQNQSMVDKIQGGKAVMQTKFVGLIKGNSELLGIPNTGGNINVSAKNIREAENIALTFANEVDYSKLDINGINQIHEQIRFLRKTYKYDDKLEYIGNYDRYLKKHPEIRRQSIAMGYDTNNNALIMTPKSTKIGAYNDEIRLYAAINSLYPVEKTLLAIKAPDEVVKLLDEVPYRKLVVSRNPKDPLTHEWGHKMYEKIPNIEKSELNKILVEGKSEGYSYLLSDYAWNTTEEYFCESFTAYNIAEYKKFVYPKLSEFIEKYLKK